VPVPDAAGECLAGVVRGWQWLTSDSSFDQSWNTRVTARCDRTEVRFSVDVPLLELDRLFLWDGSWQDFGYTAETARKLAELGGGSVERSASWWIFRGPIPYGWVVEVVERPGVSWRSAPSRCGVGARRRS
jgi:hypothetical protein